MSKTPKAFNESIEIIKQAIKEKKPLNQKCVELGRVRNYVANVIWQIDKQLHIGTISQKQYNTIKELYNDYLEKRKGFSIARTRNKSNSSKKIKKLKLNNPSSFIPSFEEPKMTTEERKEVEYDAWKDEKFDSRSQGRIVKNDKGKISEYYYRILIHGESNLEGNLTRDEMDMVYRLYSNMDGAGLTLRSVSRYFPHLTYRDFKRILRAFNITKSSIPVAPHIIDENSEEVVADIIFRNKENNLLRRLEDDRGRIVEKNWKDTARELIEIKKNNQELEEIFKNLELSDLPTFKIKKKTIKDEIALFIYISDHHIGAMTNKDSIYNNDYDVKVYNDRLNKVLDKIQYVTEKFGRFDKIYIFNLGDCLDGYDGQTVRGGHILPQNMNNKQQFETYITSMIRFFESLIKMDITNNLEFVSVGDDNHSGDFGYMANKALQYIFKEKFPDVKVNVFDKFIDCVVYGMHTFIITHGKDGQNMKSGLPLYLDAKTENFIVEYMRKNKINSENVHFIKGDLHQSNSAYGKHFRYKNCSSIYGSSDWIHDNFGYTPPGVDYDIVSKNDSDIIEGIIRVN